MTVEALARHHDESRFDCNSEHLDQHGRHPIQGVKYEAVSVLKLARSKLNQTSASACVGDLPFGDRHEWLSGDGQHGIRFSRSWGIHFEWRDGNAFEDEFNKHRRAEHDGARKPDRDAPGSPADRTGKWE